MAEDAIGYFLYKEEKQKLTAKIGQFKSTVNTLRIVVKLNQYDAIIDRFHAAMNKRYVIIEEIYSTITERREWLFRIWVRKWMLLKREERRGIWSIMHLN